jgi:hypothetical protein
MNRSSTNSLTAIVFAERQRIRATRNPQIGPVQFMGGFLIADPVTLGVPKRARFQPGDFESSLGQTLAQYGSRRTYADNTVINRLALPEEDVPRVASVQKTRMEKQSFTSMPTAHMTGGMRWRRVTSSAI